MLLFFRSRMDPVHHIRHMAEKKGIVKVTQIIFQKEGAVSDIEPPPEKYGSLQQIHAGFIRQPPDIFP